MLTSTYSDLAVRYRLFALLVLGMLLFVTFIGLRDLWYPDELDIAEVTRAMFVSGDWIHPRRMGEIWVDYPPMIYWVGSISAFFLGDMTAFTLRLPNALASVATVLIVGWVAGRWFGARTGLWAGLVQLTFLQFVYEGNSYRPDLYFTLTITAGMLLYAEGAGERPRLALRVLAFGCFGLAILSKGPLGLLLPGLVLVLWLATQRSWLRIIELGPLALIAVAVYLPWFVATAEGMGWESMLYEFYAQNFERFLTSENRGHAQPWFYYLRNFWVDLLPWSWLFPAALWWLIRSGRFRDPKVQLALWWFATFFVFLSIAATKRQLYLLPAYPAAAILLGVWLVAVGRWEAAAAESLPSERPVSTYALLIGLLYAGIGVTLFVVLFRFAGIVAGQDLDELELEMAGLLPLPIAALGGVMLLTGVCLLHAWLRRNTRAVLVRILVGHVAMYVVILGLVMPAFNPTKTYAPQSAWISEQIGDETHIGMVYPGGSKSSSGKVVGWGGAKRGAFGYHTGTLVDMIETREAFDAFFRAHPTSLVLIHEGSVGLIFEASETAWRSRILRELRTGKHLYIVVAGPDAPDGQ